MDNKYLTLQANLEADMEYQALQQANLQADAELRQLVSQMDSDQQEIIHQYLGTLAELQMREIELALMMESPLQT